MKKQKKDEKIKEAGRPKLRDYEALSFFIILMIIFGTPLSFGFLFLLFFPEIGFIEGAAFGGIMLMSVPAILFLVWFVVGVMQEFVQYCKDIKEYKQRLKK